MSPRQSPCPVSWASLRDPLYRGLTALATQHSVALIEETPAGRCMEYFLCDDHWRSRARHLLTRQAAKPRPLYVTGAWRSGMGLDCFRARMIGAKVGRDRRHLRPQPRCSAGASSRAEVASAMIDLSDGLSTDLGHLAVKARGTVIDFSNSSCKNCRTHRPAPAKFPALCAPWVEEVNSSLVPSR